MNRKTRRIKALLLLAGMLCMLLGSIPAAAYTVRASVTQTGNTDTGYKSIAPVVDNTSDGVYDFAGLLSESEKSELNAEIQKIEKKKDYRIVVVTTAENPGTPTAYADDFFDFNDFGKDGVLFLLDMANREQWISTTGVCTEVSGEKNSSFSPGDIEDILDETTSAASDGDYGRCLGNFVNEVKKHGNLLYTLLPTTLSVVISLGLAVLTFIGLVAQHKSAAPVNNANIAVETNAFQVGQNSAVFLGARTLTKRIPKNDGGDGFGGGGGMHMGGSGTSHGGGGRGF